MAVLHPPLLRQYPTTISWSDFVNSITALLCTQHTTDQRKKICPLGITHDMWHLGQPCQERDAFITSWWSPGFCNPFLPLHKRPILKISIFLMNDGNPCLLKNPSAEIMSCRHVQNCQHFFSHTSSFQAYWPLQVAFQMPANETMQYYSRTISVGIS